MAQLVKLSDEGTVSKNAAKDILLTMFEQGGHPLEIAKKNGFIMDTDSSAVESVADEVISENPKAIDEYKQGSNKVFGFLMGQMCKKLGKSANPQIIRQVLTAKLEKL